ncbi:MAG: tyrosine recombinase XerC [Flammeovirgaceae bacterium]
MIDNFTYYLKYEKRASVHTLTAYITDLKQFEAFCQKNKPDFLLQDTLFGDIRAWMVDLINQKIEPRSINRKMASLRTFFKFLQTQGILTDNPTQKVKPLKVSKCLPIFVKPDEMKQLLKKTTFESSKDPLLHQLILELMYGTGMRLSELINLQIHNINLQSKTIKVLGKRKKERIIPISDVVVEMISKYLEIRQKSQESCLLLTEKGEPLYPMFVQRLTKEYLRKVSSVERKSPHILRHTYATHLLEEGADLNSIKELLGHSSLAATQVYTHTSLEKLKKVYRNAHPKA